MSGICLCVVMNLSVRNEKSRKRNEVCFSLYLFDTHKKNIRYRIFPQLQSQAHREFMFCRKIMRHSFGGAMQ